MSKKKEIRYNFRESVFKRDGYKCKICKNEINLDAHHITDRNYMPNGGYVIENGITLCDKHHIMAERWHNSHHQEWEEGMLPKDLYKLINSSYELAIKESEKINF